MRSKTSYFNTGLCRSLLKRFWPLWTAWFGILLLTIPGEYAGIVRNYSRYSYETAQWDMFCNLNRRILNDGAGLAVLSFFFCVLVAMAMYSYLYNNRSCSMYSSLPIKRETVFTTAFVTGIVPMLLVDVLITLIVALGFCGEGMIEFKNLMLFMLMLMLGNIAFYGMAVFCAVLTGHILVLPAVYCLLNLAAVIAESAVQAVMQSLVYGYVNPGFKLQFLSPVINISDVRVHSEYFTSGPKMHMETGVYTVEGMHWLFIYAAVGLALAFCALLIYRRRHMETAGDIVSVKLLRPVFRYSMALGVGLCFGAVVYDAVLSSLFVATGLAIGYLVFVLVGAFLGWFAAEMLMQKSLRVFKGKWKGLVICWAVLSAFILSQEFDLFGYEARVPDVDEIESVEIYYFDQCSLREPESLELVTAYHQQVIDEKAVSENAAYFETFTMEYTLKNGKTLSRFYRISDDDDQKLDDSSAVNCLYHVVNLQEAINSRFELEIPLTEQSIQSAWINSSWTDDTGEYLYADRELSKREIIDFYNQCVLPDAAEGHLGRVFPVSNEEYYNTASCVNVHFELADITNDKHSYDYKDFVINMDAQRCLDWIAENTDIEVMSLAQARPQEMESELAYTQRIG